MISYNKLISYLNRKGMSVNTLKKEGVISDHSYRRIIEDKPVSLHHIDAICQFLELPIEDIVEILLESESHE